MPYDDGPLFDDADGPENGPSDDLKEMLLLLATMSQIDRLLRRVLLGQLLIGLGMLWLAVALGLHLLAHH